MSIVGTLGGLLGRAIGRGPYHWLPARPDPSAGAYLIKDRSSREALGRRTGRRVDTEYDFANSRSRRALVELTRSTAASRHS